MKQLDRYIGKQVFLSILMVMLVVLGLNLLFTLIDELPDLTESYRLPQVLIYVLLTVPDSLYGFLPLSCLIGSLVGLGSLASHSELTVMRAAGISLWRIFWSVTRPVLLLMLFTFLLGEYVLPISEQKAESYRAVAKAQEGQKTRLAAGKWHREGEEFAHINAIDTGDHLYGVTLYRFYGGQLVEVAYAREGRYSKDQDGWMLEDIAVTRISDSFSESERIDQRLWVSKLTPQLLQLVVVDPVDLPISGLRGYIDYLERQSLNAAEYRFAFWQKVLQPVAVFVLVLLGISFIVGPLRSVTLGQRLVVGVVFGLSFKMLQELLGPASMVYGFPPLLAVLVPIIVCAMIGLWLLHRAS